MTATALVLHFLAIVGAARIERIARFMGTAPLVYSRATTREALGRLVRQGKVVRIGRGIYKSK